MRFTKHIIILLLLAGFFPALASSQELGAIRISMLDGDVQIYTPDTQDWAAASINMPLTAGSRIWVPDDSRAEIHIKGGVYIRLDRKTSLDLVSVENRSIQIYLDRGHIYLNNVRGGTDYIQVDTPLSSAGIYENTIAMVDVSENGATEVSVLKGYAYVESRSGKTRVSAGNSIYINEDMYAKMSPLGPSDEWERWNRQRDKRLLEDSESARYLPDELKEFSSDFNQNGRWVYTRDYGYVWTPTVIVSVGWSPYRIGRWVWIGGHYVWISYEPWGWVPYHYGRWTFIIGIGWCWVPPPYGAVYWGPGYVGWVYTPTYVAWVPLAPGEIYYGYGYYGPWSVNIINIDIHKTVIKQEFKNIHIKNAVTVVHRDTFVKGKKIDFRIKENPFIKEKISVGPPDIRPDRETRLPAIKPIPDVKRPPERLKMIDIEKIKKERKITKDAEASVFKPETRSEKMPVKEIGEPTKVIRREMPKKKMEPERKRPLTERDVKIPSPEMPDKKIPQPEIRQKKEQKKIEPERPSIPEQPSIPEKPRVIPKKEKPKKREEIEEKESPSEMPLPEKRQRFRQEREEGSGFPIPSRPQ